MGGAVHIEVAGRDVRLSSPDKVYFPETGLTKGDLARYYLDVGDALLRACRDRPVNLVRHPDGAGGKNFVQKRVPATRPDWLRTVEVTFPSGRTATELVIADLAHVIWALNLGCIGVHTWPVRAADPDRADELRVDLDPEPGVPVEALRQVARVVREVLAEDGLRGFVKTSGSRGLHVIARVEPVGFGPLRTAAVALAREVERRAPDLATCSWWKEERGTRVFVDYNQNTRDRTMAAAYAVRPRPTAPVSCPVAWGELAGVTPDGLTVADVPARLERLGDLHADLDASAASLDRLLARADADRAAGLGDLPWPPHFPKMPDEPPRAPPSKRRER